MWYMRIRVSDSRFSFLLAFPAWIYLNVLTFAPLLYSVFLSVNQVQLTAQGFAFTFVGFDNFLKSIADITFQDSTRFTVIYTIGAVVVEFFLGLGFALALNTIRSPTKGSFMKATALVPALISPVVVALTFTLMYQDQYGLYNDVLQVVGLPRVAWLYDPSLAILSLIMTDIWCATPLVALILLAGLSAVPQEPLESALIDGATPARILWNITLPMMKPTILVVLLMRTMDALRTFELPFLITGGGPGQSTSSLMYYAYRTTFEYTNIGGGAAMSYIIVFIIALASVAYMRLLGREV